MGLATKSLLSKEIMDGYDAMVAHVEPNLTRASQFKLAMNSMQDTATSGRTHYKNSAFNGVITSNTSTFTKITTYNDSPLLTTIEKEVFECGFTHLHKAQAEFAAGKHVLHVSEKLICDFGKPVIELFKADMLAHGFYSQCLLSMRLASVEFAEGKITEKQLTAMEYNDSDETLFVKKYMWQVKCRLDTQGKSRSTDFGKEFKKNLRGAFI